MIAADVAGASLHERISWGGVFAGLFFGAGVWIVLLVLGAAIGLSTLDPRSGASWAHLGEGVGVWGGIAAIIAAFGGGWLASFASAATERRTGVLHGLTVWGFTLMLAVWCLVSLVGAVVGGTAKVAGAAAGSAAQGAATAVQSAFAGDTITTEVNDWLRAQGKPAVSNTQLKAALSQVQTQAMARLQQGAPLDQAISHDVVVSALAERTPLSRADADAVATHVQRQIDTSLGQARGSLANTGQSLQNAGITASKSARGVSWWTFIGLTLMGIAAAVGGAVGIPRSRRRGLTEGEARGEPGTRPLTPREV